MVSRVFLGFIRGEDRMIVVLFWVVRFKWGRIEIFGGYMYGRLELVDLFIVF